MTDRDLYTEFREFQVELWELILGADLDKPDIAASLVAAAVMIAASEGCGPELQRESIERLADHAIDRLANLTDSAAIRH